MCAKKDYRIAKHPDVEASNLEVIKLCTSLKSRGLLHEIFSWQWYYWSLTDEGIEYLREYLHLPADEVPNTLKKSTKDPLRRPGGDDRRGGDRPRFQDREGYRGDKPGGEVRARPGARGARVLWAGRGWGGVRACRRARSARAHACVRAPRRCAPLARAAWLWPRRWRLWPWRWRLWPWRRRRLWPRRRATVRWSGMTPLVASTHGRADAALQCVVAGGRLLISAGALAACRRVSLTVSVPDSVTVPQWPDGDGVATHRLTHQAAALTRSLRAERVSGHCW